MIHRVEAPAGVRPRGAATPTVLPRGAVVQGYEILDFVAAGGMSQVYVARRDGERYLLKEVDGAEGRHVIALNQEKFTLERLSHPGIVRVFDLFELDGFYYLVLEFIPGQSLDKLASPHCDALLEEKVVLDWALQLCDIFAYLHGQDPPVIYRDLKPHNVIRDLRGRVRLVDFGVSRTLKDDQKARDTVLAGSTLTASPEHFGAAQTDARSDIFSLGATLSLLLSNGRSPLAEPFKF
ncbi:MAG: serine/threonine-protein kinase, partial [Candidatus Eremiobacterota bacterium]